MTGPVRKDRMSYREYRAMQGKQPKPRKYRNTPVVYDGIRFDSKREGERYLSLKLLLAAGAISDLKLQPIYVLKGARGEHVGRYIADFEYHDNATGEIVTEDVKSVVTAKTRLFQRNKNHFERDYQRKLTVVL